MDNYQNERVICPKCGHEQTIKIYPSINSQYDSDLVLKLQGDELFSFICDECGEKIPLIFNTLYHDMEHGLMVWLMPEISDTVIKEMNETAVQMKSFGMVNPNVDYRYRIVRTVNELKEKIVIEKENLDDRIIELLKVAYLIQNAENIGTKTVAELMFDVIDDGYFFTIFFEDKNLSPALMMVDMNAYKMMYERFNDSLNSTLSEGFVDISFNWAKQILFSI